jgi:hypothetical protein
LSAGRELVERELRGWLGAIVGGGRSQEACLYRPGRALACACTLALLDAGVAAPDPFACGRIEILVDRTDPVFHRRSTSAAAHPARFAEGRGILEAWARPFCEVGDLAPEEWQGRGIAAVWWRPREGGVLCEYREGEPGEPLALGSPGRGRWGEEYRAVGGPPIPNNRCPRPLRRRVMYPWTGAAPRQLELAQASGP